MPHALPTLDDPQLTLLLSAVLTGAAASQLALPRDGAAAPDQSPAGPPWAAGAVRAAQQAGADLAALLTAEHVNPRLEPAVWSPTAAQALLAARIHLVLRAGTTAVNVVTGSTRSTTTTRDKLLAEAAGAGARHGRAWVDDPPSAALVRRVARQLAADAASRGRRATVAELGEGVRAHLLGQELAGQPRTPEAETAAIGRLRRRGVLGALADLDRVLAGPQVTVVPAPGPARAALLAVTGRAEAELRALSRGEVCGIARPSRRSLRPGRDDLGCERLFGPLTDFTCYCGKYAANPPQVASCERCGVDLVPAATRSTRWAHLELGRPVDGRRVLPVVPPGLRVEQVRSDGFTVCELTLAYRAVLAANELLALAEAPWMPAGLREQAEEGVATAVHALWALAAPMASI